MDYFSSIEKSSTNDLVQVDVIKRNDDTDENENETDQSTYTSSNLRSKVYHKLETGRSLGGALYMTKKFDVNHSDLTGFL